MFWNAVHLFFFAERNLFLGLDFISGSAWLIFSCLQGRCIAFYVWFIKQCLMAHAEMVRSWFKGFVLPCPNSSLPEEISLTHLSILCVLCMKCAKARSRCIRQRFCMQITKGLLSLFLKTDTIPPPHLPNSMPLFKRVHFLQGGISSWTRIPRIRMWKVCCKGK